MKFTLSWLKEHLDTEASAEEVARTLTAIGTTAGGDEVTDLDVDWRSSNILVAPVNGNGRVTAILPGTATITAEAQGVEGTATVSVSALTGATSIDIVGGGFSLAVGETRVVSARLRDADDYTVFAFVNTGLDLLSEATRDALTMPENAALEDRLIRYHIVPGRHPSAS